MLIRRVFEDGTDEVIEVDNLEGSNLKKGRKKVKFVQILDTVTKTVLSVIGLIKLFKK